MIELTAVNKTYVTHRHITPALENINLQVQASEIFGILGRSGAGKSTLLRCMNLIERPSSGSVKINQTELTTLSAKALRRARHKIGVIFQHFNLLAARTVFDNIALPLEILHKSKQDIQRTVNELLDWVGLTTRKDYYPAQLSGGQQQRVAIARALATQPLVLLSDEATSALDPESTQDILKLLKKINQEMGVTIVLITHELTVIKQICDRVGVIHEGRFIEQNETVSLLTQPQTALTKQFIQQSFHLPAVTPSLTPHNYCIVQLTFVGETSNMPVISTLIQHYDLTVNIRQAQIESVKNTMIGLMICELIGDDRVLQLAIAYLQSTAVQVEVLAHG